MKLLAVSQILLVGLLGDLLAAEETGPETASGVVVEEVGEGSVLAKAGIEPGDVLLAWRRLPAPPTNPKESRGKISSAFDWIWLDLEQAPRGTVELTVRRHEADRVFTVAPGLWEAEVRPRMPDDLLGNYLQGREYLEAGEIGEAVSSWEKVVSAAKDWRLRCWMGRRIGEVWVKQGEWQRAQATYRSALEQAREPFPKTVLWRAFGNVYSHQNESEQARQAYSSATKIRERTWGKESLALAQSLNDLGVLAFYRGDLARATELLQRALEISQELAPGSLTVAASLCNLGIVFASTSTSGELASATDLYQRALAIQQKLAPDSLDVALTLNNLGTVARQRGNLTRARDLFQRALVIEQELAPESLAVATTLSNLGEVAQQRGDLTRARDLLQRALVLQKRLIPDGLRVAETLNNLGNVAWQRDDLDRATDFHQRALAIRQELAPYSLDVAASLANLGNVALSRGDLDRATDFLQRALQIDQKLVPDSLRVAGTLNNLGVVAWQRGDLDLAMNSFRRALQIRNKLAPDSLDVAASLNNLGGVAWQHGDLDQVIGFLQRSLDIQQRLAPDSLTVATSLNNLGSVATRLGDLAQAADYLQRALEIQQKLAPDSLTVATGLNNLGDLALGRGNLDRAADYFQRAVEIKQKQAPDSLTLAASLNNLGFVALERGDLAGATNSFSPALDLRKKLAPNSTIVAASLNNLGDVAMKQGHPARAAEFLERALEIREKLAPNSLDVAYSLNSLGILALNQGYLDRAMGYFQRALEIRERLAPDSVGVAEILHELARLHRQKKPSQLAIAHEFLQRTIDTLEKQLTNFGGSHDIRSAFRAQYEEYYHTALAIQLKLEQPAAGFHTLERSRARSFLEHLTERDTVFIADIPKELDQARRRLAVFFDRTQEKLAGLNPREDAKQIDDLLAQLRRLGNEGKDIEEKIRRASPRLATLQYPQPLDLETSRAALDPGTLLLSYSVGEESTVLFSFSKEHDLSVERLNIDEKKLRAQVDGFRKLTEDIDSFPRHKRSFEALAKSLYASLIEPVVERVEPSARLLILADGPLHYLPWAALLRDTAEGNAQYLLEWKPLHLALSATVYAELRKLRREDDGSPTPVQLTAFGDPQYPGSRAAAAGRGDAVVRSVAERVLFEWEPLPYTRREVQGIASGYPAEQVRAYLGAEATEERAKSLGRDVNIVHFATHGRLDERFPLNSFLALTIPEEYREGYDNGLLQAWEIFERMRIDADLVVLSACQSAVGTEQGGEGLIGLTRAFQYAGARSVLATLWSVADRSTAELMVRFYRHLRGGRPKDEALRAAQLELLRGPIQVRTEQDELKEVDASAPYYWAAFQIYGDWQ